MSSERAEAKTMLDATRNSESRLQLPLARMFRPMRQSNIANIILANSSISYLFNFTANALDFEPISYLTAGLDEDSAARVSFALKTGKFRDGSELTERQRVM